MELVDVDEEEKSVTIGAKVVEKKVETMKRSASRQSASGNSGDDVVGLGLA